MIHKFVRYAVWTGISCASAACGGDEGPSTPQEPSELALPGDSFYPESLTVAADGTLYVGSLATGQVVAFAPGSAEARAFVAGGDPKNVTGVFADGASSTLFVCSVNITQEPPPVSEMYAYDLQTGALKKKYQFPNSAFCEDFAVDDAGNLYVDDPVGQIFVLKKGKDVLELWSNDPLLAPPTPFPAGVGADGIAYDGDGNIYVNTFDEGGLVRISIQADGSAGAAVKVALDAPLGGPDGMRMLDRNTLIVAENKAGRLTKISLSGDTAATTVVRADLKMPSSVVKRGANYWVTEGQLRYLLAPGSGAPTLPFSIKRVPAQ